MTAEVLTSTARRSGGIAQLRSLPTAGNLTPRPIGVLIAGGDPLACGGVAQLLDGCPDIRTVSDAAEADIALVLIDKVGDGLVDIVGTVSHRCGPRVVLLVGEQDLNRSAELLRAGALGILRRGQVSRPGLRRVIRSVMAGDAVLPADVLGDLLATPSGPDPESNGDQHGISSRESNVLRLLADGSDTREVAHRLCYSERTVKTIIQDITQRYGLRNRSHAVAYAIRSGLI